MMRYFELVEFEPGHKLPYLLSIIKSSLLSRPEAFHDFAEFYSEGYLGGREAISLTIKVSIPTRSPFGLQPEERIALSCTNNGDTAVIASALRKEFPSLPHLNLTGKGRPRELCLFAVQMMDEMYNRPFLGLIRRIKDWLDRAAAGELHLDGQAMEPLLVGADGDFVLDKKTYDRMLSGEKRFELYPIYHRAYPPRYLYLEVTSAKVKEESSKNPFAVLSLESEPSSDQRINFRPENYSELYDLLKERLQIDLDLEIRQFVEGLYKTPSGNKNLDKNLFLVLSIPRVDSKGEPRPPEIMVFHVKDTIAKIGTAVGFLKQQAAKKKQVYVLQKECIKQPEELIRMKVAPFKTIMPFTKELAQSMSGTRPEIAKLSIAVIGLGALGSQVVMNLSRQGFSRWRLVDHDILMPHNFARHALSGSYRGILKAEAVKREIELIYEGADVIEYPAAFPGFQAAEVQKALETDLILDFSASTAVLLKLSYREKPNQRAYSAYYNGDGHTSVLLCEDIERTIRLDDLDLQLKIRALESELARSIYDAQAGKAVYSTSCADTTAVIPQDIVGIKAGLISKQIRTSIQDNNAKIWINLIDKDGNGVRTETITPAKTIFHQSGEWQFRISQDSINEMESLRSQRLPDETGGVLIGWINTFQKIVYVGKALPAPPDSEERPYYFQRGKKGLNKAVKEISDLSNGDLNYVGEWHSHPPGVMPTPSAADAHCMKIISKMMLEGSLPGIMIIIGDSGRLRCNIQWGHKE